MTIRPASTARVSAPAYSGKALIALTIALVALLLPSPIQIFVAALAIVAALISKRELRQNAQLRGASVSLLAFLIATGTVVISSVPWVFGVVGLFQLSAG